MATTKSIKLKLSNRAINAAIKNNQLPLIFKCDSNIGLELHVNADGKGRWKLCKRINGVLRKQLLGLRSEMSVEQAQEVFNEYCYRARHNIRDVKTSKNDVTLQSALDQMLDAGGIKESTAKSYRHLTTQNGGMLYSYRNKPLVSITDKVLQKLYQERTAGTGKFKNRKPSASMADRDARTLRLLWRWSEKHLGITQPIPTDALKKSDKVSGEKSKKWNKPKRRKTTIRRSRLPEWFSAVRELQQKGSHTVQQQAYAAELLILMGLREKEILSAEWSWVDLGHGTITVPESISKNDDALVRPMTERVAEIISHLKRSATKRSKYIFEVETKGAKRPPTSIRQVMRRVESMTADEAGDGGIRASANDMRRTMASAGIYAGIALSLIKKLMNHRIGEGGQDVTLGYVSFDDPEVLLEASQRIENYLLEQAGLKEQLSSDLIQQLAALGGDQREQLLKLLQGA